MAVIHLNHDYRNLEISMAYHKFLTGYFLTKSGEKFTAHSYSKQLPIFLKLTPENYRGENYEICWEYSDHWNGLEFMIKCESFEIAQNVLMHVMCAAAVIEGTLTWSNDPHYPHLKGTNLKRVGFQNIHSPARGYSSLQIPHYFYLTAKISHSTEFVNAVLKYQLSTEIYSRFDMDLHESTDWKITAYPFIQMRFAYAIIAAYSVIEELNINIQGASSTKPSIRPDGSWDPNILCNLQNRLKLLHINFEEDIPWMIRGEATAIEKRKPVQVQKRASWAHPEDMEPEPDYIKVNDGYVHLHDAINYISHLRSSISSHKVGARILALSVFDVANAQFLARRMILESCGLWKNF